jgi:hypothetical protein
MESAAIPRRPLWPKRSASISAGRCSVFYDFCKSNNLIDEVQNKQWNAFGQVYNGDGAVYGPKLKDAFDTKQALLALPKTPNPPLALTVMPVGPAYRRSAAVKPKRSRAKPKSSRTRLKSTKPKSSRARLKSKRAKPKSSRRKVA